MQKVTCLAHVVFGIGVDDAVLMLRKGNTIVLKGRWTDRCISYA